MNPNPRQAPETTPVAIVTGGSSGLGRSIAEHFLDAGFHVVIVGRDQDRLDTACQSLGEIAGRHAVLGIRADVRIRKDAADAVAVTTRHFGRIDALVNCVGASDRGLTEHLTLETMDTLVTQNLHTALLCSQSALPELRKTRGSIVNIGSLASKVGARYIGGYAVAKHALAGLTQQMRLELRQDHVHVGIVCPGPIRRDDAGVRYRELEPTNIPAGAMRPGGGARMKGLPPAKVAAAVVRCVRKRTPEIILPGYLRILITLGNAFPRLGDWLLLRFTSSGAPTESKSNVPPKPSAPSKKGA